MGSRLEGARGRWAGKAGGRANRCPSEAANTVSRESKPLGAGWREGEALCGSPRVGRRFHQEMVELHAAWTQAARVGTTAGRAAEAEAKAEEAAEEAAEAAAEEEELLLGCI